MFLPLVVEVTEHPFYRTDDCAMALWFTKLNSPQLVAVTPPPTEFDPGSQHGLPGRLRGGFRWTRERQRA